MKEIKLTQGKVALVDDEDFEWLSEIKWYSQKGWKSIYYAATFTGGRLTKKMIYMHRLIVQASDIQQVDHINGNGLDNRRVNLRLCTSTQNHANSRKQDDCSSKFKGVCWFRPAHLWSSEITKSGIKEHLGYFRVEEDAARAYDIRALELFGEFALTNTKAGLL